MLYWLIEFADKISFLNVFRYITFRTGGATMTALVFVFVAGSPIIDLLRLKQGRGQPIRDDGPQSHRTKKIGTPTMGGLMILSGVTLSTMLWANPANPYVWIVLGVTLAFGVIGFYDDYLKVTQAVACRRVGEGAHRRRGGWSRRRPALRSRSSAARLSRPRWCFRSSRTSSSISASFSSIFGAFIIVGAGNAVNLTDGLDGLAIVPVMIAALSFGLISYLAGNAVFADYLNIHYVAGTGELAVLCGAVIGAGLGFLWFNAPPASIFMGDTGSLALGGMIGTIAVATKHEIALAIIGGLFVLEAVSVIVQVVSFKLTGKRVFAMAPIHHHYEQKGWTEPQIVIRFWIISIVLALVGLSTLKLR